ncbi:Fc.00g079680.m01.CDS01 [Cosmosporella sp. VM-42]
MPIHLALGLLENGLPSIVGDHLRPILYTLLSITVLVLLKFYTSGRTNPAERPLHGKVVLLTGGTSGIGAATALHLAARGAQLCLLTQTPASDPFLVEYIQDLRAKTNNPLIYTEQVDLASFHSVRKFATKWIDNSPPRRLDMVILCAATMTPPGGKRKETEMGIEETWMVNFLANFHLLGILSPALRAQPIDRDVRVIIPTCSSYIGSPSLKEAISMKNWSPGTAYARSKLAMNVFGQAYQKHLSSYKRPDNLPSNTRVVFVDPGLARTPSTRRWLTRGSLWGLGIYLLGYAIPWFLLKSPNQAAQSILYAAMENGLGRGEGGKLIKECMEVDFARAEVNDVEVAKKLWEETDALIEKVEKQEAKRRAVKKAEADKMEMKREEQEKQKEVESLVEAIKKGKEKEKQKESRRSRKKGKAT